MIRVFLADDELLSLQRLKDLFGRIGGIDIVGEAQNGRAAAEGVIALRPDAVFLDIDMPLLDGFDVVEAIARDARLSPLIVFVTAYPKFAVTAFDSGAIDFLTKPVRLSRLETAMGRIRDALEQRTARDRLQELALQLDALRERHAPERTPDHLWVQCRGQKVRLDLAEVERISAEGEYVRLHAGQESYLHRSSITAMAERLGPEAFVRIHRSVLVARAHVARIGRRRAGGYEIVTSTGVTLPVGRLYRAIVKTITEGPDRDL